MFEILDKAEHHVLEGAKRTLTDPIYISGPMTGVPAHNFPEFNRVAKLLRDRGHNVVNPAELPMGGTDGSWASYLARDLVAMLQGPAGHSDGYPYCKSVVQLENWQGSRGAVLEKVNAFALGMSLHSVKEIE